MHSFENKINDFLKNVTEARKKSGVDLLRLDDNTLALVSMQSIKILTETQKELVELLVDSPRTGADLARLTEDLPYLTSKSPQFISKYMKELVKWGIVEHIEAPFGRSKFYVLKANIIGKDEISKVQSEAIPNVLLTAIEKRGVVGNLMSLSFKEILDLIRELDDKEKQKVLDFIIEYCQVEEE
ncbi:MAG: hypothetical protein JXA54_14370 [Candidatus Heimdallarchaeota archaeon]|nr:hypothetical protein [Candidatus Heimdallarchaeota archaeon]